MLPILTNDNFLNTREVMERLNITHKVFERIKEEENLQSKSIKKRASVYYPVSIIEELESKKEHLLTSIEDDYYTEEEVLTLVQTKYIPNSINDEKFYVPSLVRGTKGYKYPRKFYVFPKKSVQKYLEWKEKENEEISLVDPYLEFERQLKEQDIEFPENLSETKKIWFRFVKDHFLSTSRNEVGIKKEINRFVKETKFLTIIPKEINEMLEKEINLLFLGDKQKENFRIDLYKFLRYAHFIFISQNKKTYSIEKLKSPYIKKNVKSKENSLYSYDNYKKVFDYCNMFEFHSKNAINDSGYSFSWLYVSIHLNNAWRHHDVVTGIPRIKPEEVGITSLKELKNRKLTFEEAEKIINQIKRTYMIHGKTGNTRRFFCSKQLMISMATCLCFCELHIRKENPFLECLIYFKNKNKIFTKLLHKNFFYKFEEPFIFESRKMNRTLLTFVDSIIRKSSKGNSLETTKYLRGHSSIESTNVYVQISQEHLDFLTEQLFSRDSFGYIPELFAKLLYGQEENFELRSSQINEIKEKLGSVYKLEWISGVLNQFKEEKNLIDDLFQTMDEEEMKNLHTKITLDLLPSKEENYQCLMSETGCVYPMRNCYSCPLSIPNYYAISSICNRVLKNIVEFNSCFEKANLEAEKTRLSNLLHRDLQLLQNAMNKFGKEEVYQILEVDSKIFKEALKNLPNHKEYITLKKGD